MNNHYEVQKILFELNSKYHEESEVRELVSQLIGVEVEKTFRLRPPFYTDFGKNIRIGKNVFINQGCTFMDRGGITLEDDVLIGPKVNLVTINHPLWTKLDRLLLLDLLDHDPRVLGV